MKIAMQGYATTQRFDMDTAYKMLKDAGFEAIDWAIDQQWENGKQRQCWDRNSIQSGQSVEQNCIYDKDMDEIIAHYQPELDIIKKYGLTITQAHAPFYSYSSKNVHFTEYAIKTYEKALKLCAYAGCPRLVVHGFSRHVDDLGINDNDIHIANMKMYAALIPAALETGVTILLENLFTSYDGKRYAGTCCDPYDAIAYIDTLNEMAGRECFGLCFDTGHINLVRDPIPEYVQKLGKRIKALHIHDNDSQGDMHLAPYTGSVRWNDFYNSLKEIGYDGDLSFEAFRQVVPSRCDDEMVAPSLEFIYKCGEFFRSRILG